MPIDVAAFNRATEELTNAIASVRPELDDLNCLPRQALGRPPPPFHPGEAQQCLDGLLGGIVACTGAAKGNIQVYEPTEGVLRIRAHVGLSPAFLSYFEAVRTQQAACGLALHVRGTVLISDVATSPVFTEEARGVVLQEDIRALQSTVLSCESSNRVGVVTVHYRKPGVPESGQDLLRQFAPRLAEVVALCAPPPEGD